MPMPNPLRETRDASIIVAAVAIVVAVLAACRWRLVVAHNSAALTLPISKVHQD